MRTIACPFVAVAALLLSVGVARTARADRHATNACGCYTVNNECYCERKAKCGCPGECEPKGCEEARQKKLQKEINEETKRAIEEEQARSKPAGDAKQAGQAEQADTSTDERKEGASPAHAAKPRSARHMNSAQRRRLLKLIDAYLAAHPDAGDRSLIEVRDDLK